MWIVILIKVTLLTTVEEFEWASAHCLNTCHVELPKKPGYPIHSLLSHKWISCIQHSDICFLLNQLWLPSTSPQSNGHWCDCLSWERSPSTCFHLEAKNITELPNKFTNDNPPSSDQKGISPHLFVSLWVHFTAERLGDIIWFNTNFLELKL